ncbi:unnamed protein product [Blepharisma stoltei]|uniref:Acyl-coenzyme A oxidase n=1 Tax=Blepharisma stoltei TaxID=1481888 RepID=A0AAU9K3N1_9CILI|nr:unnamed protein product [Blepharisma stoltei]
MSNLRRLDLLKTHLLSKFPTSSLDRSLDEYRGRGEKINSSLLSQLYFEDGYDTLMKMRKAMTKNPLFNHYEEAEMPREKLRERVVQQIASLYFSFNLSYEVDKKWPLGKCHFCFGLAEHDLGLTTRFCVHIILYIDTLQNIGTKKHLELINRAYQLLDYGSFGMTELGHGSNVAKVETTATYDHNAREFIINSPTPTSAKWWIGAAGKTANMSVVFAQLIVDGVGRGVHAFVVPVRDYATHETLPGVILGDCGKKLSNDGIDNGFMLFKNYRVPYDALLDKYSWISPDGKFKTSFKNQDKRLAVMLGGLIRGRTAVVIGSEQNMRHALTIALRFSAIRKQFGLQNGPEVPILDYQTQRYRLIPHLARAFAIRTGGLFLCSNYIRIRPKIDNEPESDDINEHHAFLSAFKVVASSYGVACTQDCREAVGGLGYSSYSALGRLRANQDTHLTWEGDNTVLIQQAGKFIFKQIQRTFKGYKINAPTLSILKTDYEECKALKQSFENSQQLENEKMLMELIEFKFNHLLHKALLKVQENAQVSTDMLEVWNNSQVFHIQDLGKVYGEYVMAREFLKFVHDIEAKCEVTGRVIRKLFYLYVVDTVDRSIGLFLENALNSQQAKIVKDSVIRLCNEIAPSSVSIVDALAAPDNVLGSAIGNSDGQMYTHMIESVENGPNVYEKPEWLPLIHQIREASKSKQ